jgi:hypothetical protein
MQARGYTPRDANEPVPHMASAPVIVTEHRTQPLPTAEAEARLHREDMRWFNGH